MSLASTREGPACRRGPWRDARKLAELRRGGLLTAVHVPALESDLPEAPLLSTVLHQLQDLDRLAGGLAHLGVRVPQEGLELGRHRSVAESSDRLDGRDHHLGRRIVEGLTKDRQRARGLANTCTK